MNCVYRLVSPRTFEPVHLEASWDRGNITVKPTHLSICNADQRYYQGTRNEKALNNKLPMALIHEGIGIIVEDPTGTYERGSPVVIIPNRPVEQNDCIAENYLYSSRFCGSGCDGFMQEYLVIDPARAIALPEAINKDIAAFTELVSVATHAIRRFDRIAHHRRCAIGIWGDGNVGFVVSLLLRMLYPAAKVFVVGRNPHKLNDFTFADETYLGDEVDILPPIDHAFECCGGEGSVSALRQIIDSINPEGTISLLGVSESAIPINTRMILEKGLQIFGSSRSGRDDFLQTIQWYKQYPVILDYLSALVENVVDVRSVLDMVTAFELDSRKTMGKTIMHWNV